jgi:hypothetical protein
MPVLDPQFMDQATHVMLMPASQGQAELAQRDKDAMPFYDGMKVA